MAPPQPDFAAFNYKLGKNGYVIRLPYMINVMEDGELVQREESEAHIPPDPANSDRQFYDRWLASGRTPLPADPDPPEPTVDEIYDQLLQNQRLLKAVVLAINDGSLTVGGNRTPTQLKAIIKAKM
jgi:hypothetical protein